VSPLATLLHLEQFDIKDECLVGPDHTTRSAWSIGEVRWYEETDFSAGLDELEPLGPARDHPVQRKFDRLVALVGTVEFRAVEQSASVVHFHGVRGLGRRTRAGRFDEILQTARGLLHAGFRCVLGKEFLASFECGLGHDGVCGEKNGRHERGGKQEVFQHPLHIRPAVL
jgi:hypothetical protein